MPSPKYFNPIAGGDATKNCSLLQNFFLDQAATIPADEVPTISEDVISQDQDILLGTMVCRNLTFDASVVTTTNLNPGATLTIAGVLDYCYIYGASINAGGTLTCTGTSFKVDCGAATFNCSEGCGMEGGAAGQVNDTDGTCIFLGGAWVGFNGPLSQLPAPTPLLANMTGAVSFSGTVTCLNVVDGNQTTTFGGDLICSNIDGPVKATANSTIHQTGANVKLNLSAPPGGAVTWTSVTSVAAVNQVTSYSVSGNTATWVLAGSGGTVTSTVPTANQILSTVLGGNYVTAPANKVQLGYQYGVGGTGTTGTLPAGGGEVMIPIAPATVSVAAGSTPAIIQDVSTADNKVSTLSLQVTAAGSGQVALSLAVRVAASGQIVPVFPSLKPYLFSGNYPILVGQTSVFVGIPIIGNAVDSVVVYATQSALTSQNVTSSGSLA